MTGLNRSMWCVSYFPPCNSLAIFSALAWVRNNYWENSAMLLDDVLVSSNWQAFLWSDVAIYIDLRSCHKSHGGAKDVGGGLSLTRVVNVTKQKLVMADCRHMAIELWSKVCPPVCGHAQDTIDYFLLFSQPNCSGPPPRALKFKPRDEAWINLST
jgi:hypothetical protein